MTVPLSACRIDPLLPDRPIPVVVSPRPSGRQDFAFLLSFVKDNCAAINKVIGETGAVLFRGFEVRTAEQFEQIALLIKPNLSKQYLGTSPRTSTSEYTFTASEIGPSKPVAAHCEMAFLPNSKPERIFFCCLQPSEYGGETPIVRVDHVLRDMPARVRSRFEAQGVRYVRNYAGKASAKSLNPFQLKPWEDVFETTDPREIQKMCDRDGVAASFSNDGKDLRLSNTQPAILAHPQSKIPVWSSHAAVFNIWGPFIEMTQVLRYRWDWRTAIFGLIVWILTITMKFIYSAEQQAMNSFYGDGVELSYSDIKAISDATWKNYAVYKWQKGDIVAVDNNLVAHGRLPFRGSRKRVVLTAFG